METCSTLPGESDQLISDHTFCFSFKLWTTEVCPPSSTYCGFIHKLKDSHTCLSDLEKEQVQYLAVMCLFKSFKTDLQSRHFLFWTQDGAGEPEEGVTLKMLDDWDFSGSIYKSFFFFTLLFLFVCLFVCLDNLIYITCINYGMIPSYIITFDLQHGDKT